MVDNVPARRPEVLTKNSSARHWILSLDWPERLQAFPYNTDLPVLGCLLQLGSKASVFNTSHSLAAEHGEIKLELS